MLKSVHLCVKCFRRGDEACLLCILALPGETPPPRAFPDAFLAWVDPDPPTKTSRPEAALTDSPYQSPQAQKGRNVPASPAFLDSENQPLCTYRSLLHRHLRCVRL